MRTLSALVLLSGCGDAGSDSVEPPTGPASTAISLEAIAGRWAGTTVELRTPNVYTTRLRINPSTRLNGLGGYAEVDDAGFVNLEAVTCQSVLHTLTVAADVWSFSETVQAGQCTRGDVVRAFAPNGGVVLRLLSNGDLAYAYYGSYGRLSATATLKRQP